MRKELGVYHNQYIEVEGEFLRLADNCHYLLFRNVTHNGKVITDHIWVAMNDIKNAKEVKKIRLKRHTVYKIRGKVYTYLKYNKTKKKMVQDYCLKSIRIEMGE